MRVLFLILSISLSFYSTAATTLNQGASFDAGFSPNGDSLQLILKAINSAKKSIHVAAYNFISKPIAKALLNASKRGIDVKIVADEKADSGK